MRGNSEVLQIVCAILLLIPGLCRASLEDDLSGKLGASVHEYSLTADNFVGALARVASDFRIPMEIAWIDASPTNPKLNLHWRATTVKEIIESIAKSQPGYEVANRNGVVHVFTTSIPDNQNFLLIKIKSFVVRNEVVQMAERKLKNSISLATAPSHLGQGGIGGSLITMVGEPRIDVQEMNDTTVLDVLDRLATVSRKKICIVTFSASPAPTSMGFRRTRTLWNSSPVPDEQQPVWNMFSWGETIPSVGLLGR